MITTNDLARGLSSQPFALSSRSTAFISGFFPFFVSALGSLQGLQWLDSFSDRLIRLAHDATVHSNTQSHLKLFTQFCNDLGHQPLPVQVTMILRYLNFLSTSGRVFITFQSHISSINHFHLLLGFAPGWESAYLFQLHCSIAGIKTFAWEGTFLETPYCFQTFVHCSFVHAAMWAHFLVAFFSFLRKSNLHVVVDSPSAASDKLPHRFSSQGCAFADTRH